MAKTQRYLNILRSQRWLDVRTRAVVAEFTLYNANVNLFASVIMLAEWLPTGVAVTSMTTKVG